MMMHGLENFKSNQNIYPILFVLNTS